jgi:hypothetical protein
MKTRIAVLLTVSACIVGYFVMAARADDREIDELRAEAAAILRHVKERHNQLSEGEVVRLKKQAHGLLEEAEELAEHHERREREVRDHKERELHDREHGERHEGVREQINHIRTAAEHLHAAGMNELAEDLMHQAEERERDFERRQAEEREGQHDERLHRHVEELSQHVRELHGRLERIEKAILELSDRATSHQPKDPFSN